MLRWQGSTFKALFLVALVWSLALPSLLVAAQSTPEPATTSRLSTAILVSPVGVPMRIAGSDHADHIEYDLLVTNAFTAPVTLTSLEVFDESGNSLLILDEAGLAGVTQSIFVPTPVSSIPVDGTVAVVVGITVPSDQPVSEVSHRVEFEVADDAPGRTILATTVVEGPTLPVSSQAPIVIAPPLSGDGWLAANGCCVANTLHRAVRISDGVEITKSELFAIDWARLEDGAWFAGDGSQNEDWYGFGAEVLAVADGTVVSVRDGMPEEAPLQAPQHLDAPEDYAGNEVIVEIAPGVYAFYAHLQTGSVTVEIGDTVEVGDVLGLLGNTGSTAAAHLHFGLLDYPDPLVGNSLPMVFDEYTLVGTVDPAAIERMDVDPSDATLEISGTPEEQTETLQLVYTVANFD